MGRFAELTDKKKEVVLAAAAETEGEMKGHLNDIGAVSRTDLRAKQIANNPQELNRVLGEAGIATHREDKANSRKHPRIFTPAANGRSL